MFVILGFRVLSILTSCFLGTVLIVSASLHLTNPILFFEDLMGYEIVGQSTAMWLTLIMPPVMFVCGMAIINRLASKSVLIATSLLLLAFVFSQSVAFVRGLKINCGCFGAGSHEVGWLSIAFTSACLLGNLFLLWDKYHEKPEVQGIYAD